jgi:hypothetical protein
MTSLRKHCHCVYVRLKQSIPPPSPPHYYRLIHLQQSEFSSLLWFDRHLKYSIKAFAKDPVPFFDLVKRKAVCQQRR